MDFEKHYIINKEEMARMQAKQLTQYDPNVKALVDLKNKMMDLLSDPALDDFSKSRMSANVGSELSTRYQHLKNAGTSASTPAPAPAAADVPPVAAAVEDADAPVEMMAPIAGPSRSIKTEPHYRTNRANSILNLVMRNPDIIDTNENGEVVIRGNTIRGSNFEQLMTSLDKSTTKLNTKGRKDFMGALKELKVSPSQVKNRSAKNYLQTGKGFPIPPNTRAKVLSLYKV